MSDTPSFVSRFTGKVYPLMPPDERRALWRSVQAVWQRPVSAMIAELEQSRKEWDQSALPR